MTRYVIHLSDESGQTMAEYAVVLAVITLAIVATFGFLSGAYEAAFDEAADLIASIT
jgi:Flp pilus assembly pilin Flp